MCGSALEGGSQVVAMLGSRPLCENAVLAALFLSEGAGEVGLELGGKFLGHLGLYSSQDEGGHLAPKMVCGLPW